MKHLVFATALALGSLSAALGAHAATAPASITRTNAATVYRHDLNAALAEVYGADKAPAITEKALALAQKIRAARPADLREEDRTRPADWYKDEVVYMLYADQWNLRDGEDKGNFKRVTEGLDRLKDLGVTTVYILPFLDSPMGDAGFDIRDPRAVREDLGGTEAFLEFVREARKRGLKVKADLALNHFSDQHAWFQAALKGDLSKLDRFLVRTEKPKSRAYVDPQKGAVVEYDEPTGEKSVRRLIFPEITDSHYREVKIGDKNYYVYHTFYPFQLDLNWDNPEVMLEMMDVLGGWANIGVDVFRLDAIPFLIKRPGTDGESRPETHAIVRALSLFLQSGAPRSIMLAEANQWPKELAPYFGVESRRASPFDAAAKPLLRTNEVQAAYHFPMMPGIWSSLIAGNTESFWKAVAATPVVPSSATWGLFLRVHDELTLEMVDPETRKLLFDALVGKGAEFRKGFGVSGRLANFLDQDPRRIRLAYSLLFSLPGLPIIYYGDEIGATNNLAYADRAAVEREENQKKFGLGGKFLSYYDSRDINRGPIRARDLDAAQNGANANATAIRSAIRELLAQRKGSAALRRGSLEAWDAKVPSVLAYYRRAPKESLLVLHNLSGETKTVALPEGLAEKTHTLEPYASAFLSVH